MQVFPTIAGGAERMASSMGVTLLGRVPLDPAVSRACESGQSLFEPPLDGEADGSVAGKARQYQPTSLPALNSIVSKLIERLGT